jgi:predicted Na+-dependent transporter
MWKEKLGNYLIDISKYFLTGVFVASLVKDLENTRWIIYTVSGTVSIILLITGLILTNKNEDKSWKH